MADYNQAIELNPSFVQAYLNRGILYDDQGKGDLALADYNQAIALNPNDALAYANRGILYADLKQTEKAVTDLKKAAELLRQQGNTAAYEQVMQMLQQLGG